MLTMWARSTCGDYVFDQDLRVRVAATRIGILIEDVIQLTIITYAGFQIISLLEIYCEFQ